MTSPVDLTTLLTEFLETILIDGAAAGQALLSNGYGVPPVWGTGTGLGDVNGPASAVDNAIVRFDGTTGKAVQGYTSGTPTISDGGALTLAPTSNGPVLTVAAASVTGEAVPFNFVYTKNAYVATGCDGANYYDDVVSWGWNLGASGPIVAGKQMTYFQMENNFCIPPYSAEVHLNHTDANGTTRRLWSFGFAKDGASGNNSHGIRIDKINWGDWTNNTTKIQWDFTATNLAFIYDSFALAHQNNNVAWLKQRNAADSQNLSMAYFDSDDRLRAQSSGVYVGATPTSGTYPNDFFVVQPTSLASGGTALYVPIVSVTGSIRPFRFEGPATTDFSGLIYNQSNTSVANAGLEILTREAGGKGYVRFNINSGTQWYVGSDRADSGAFTIGAGLPGTSNKLRMDTSGNVSVTSVRGTAVAFASVPASPVEGMLVAVTDSSTAVWGATITGSGANHVLAYYNGTNWTVAGK